MLKHMLAISLLGFVPVVMAGSVTGTTVLTVRIDKTGKGIASFKEALANPGGCIDRHGYASHMSFDTATEGGKAIYSLLLAAQNSGRRVTAHGNIACDHYPNTVESINTITIY